MRRRFLGNVLGLAAFALCAAAAPALAAPDGAPIYRWVDADGIAHYTTDPERIPTALRGRLPEPAPEREAQAVASQARTRDVWAERDRPPDASPVEDFDEFESDFGADDPARRVRIDEIDARIDQLLGHIRTDEEALKQRVVGSADPLSTGADEELRVIAARLPGLLAELRELRDERASLEAR